MATCDRKPILESRIHSVKVQRRCKLKRSRWTKLYRAEKKSLQILLSSTKAGPGRKVKQEQEEISRNHVPRLFLGSVAEPGPSYANRDHVSFRCKRNLLLIGQRHAQQGGNRSVSYISVSYHDVLLTYTDQPDRMVNSYCPNCGTCQGVLLNDRVNSRNCSRFITSVAKLIW